MPWPSLWSLSLTARKARVDATTMAALEESPEPAGTVPVNRRSTGVGLHGEMRRNLGGKIADVSLTAEHLRSGRDRRTG